MNKASPATNKAGTKDTSHLRDIFTISFNYLYSMHSITPAGSYSFNNVFFLYNSNHEGPGLHNIQAFKSECNYNNREEFCYIRLFLQVSI